MFSAMTTVATIHGLLESFEHITGFLFVMFVLALLWLIVAVIGTLFKKGEERNANKATTPAVPFAPAPLVDPNEVSEEDLVVIAATAVMMLGKRSRLISIKPSNLDWGREGRRQHVMSHTTR